MQIIVHKIELLLRGALHSIALVFNCRINAVCIFIFIVCYLWKHSPKFHNYAQWVLPYSPIVYCAHQMVYMYLKLLHLQWQLICISDLYYPKFPMKQAFHDWLTIKTETVIDACVLCTN